MLEYLKSVDTPTLANAIESLQVRPDHEGFTPLEIRCMFPDFGRMSGYAVTAQVETMTELEPGGDRQFMDLYEAIAASPKPAVVVLHELGDRPSYAAHCGEVMATMFSRLGAVGLVSDCAVRDLAEVRAVRFHLFARGAVSSHAHFRIVRVGMPVRIAGLTVCPGDLLHGDENGLLLVPPCKLEDLQRAVDSVRRKEKELLDYVRGPEFNLESLRRRMLG